LSHQPIRIWIILHVYLVQRVKTIWTSVII
jgi:hypothetical protein